MKVLDLFSGLGGFSQAFKDRGHDVTTIDIDPDFKPSVVADIMSLAPADVDGYDIILASPPCNHFSVMVIGRNWIKGTLEPKTPGAAGAIALVKHTLDIIGTRPYVMENPRAMLRKFIEPTATIWYCRYGERRAKPTDIWTNISALRWRPPCNKGNPDHEPAPRGSRGGTKGLKNAALRALIPYELSLDICTQMEAIL